MRLKHAKDFINPINKNFELEENTKKIFNMINPKTVLSILKKMLYASCIEVGVMAVFFIGESSWIALVGELCMLVGMINVALFGVIAASIVLVPAIIGIGYVIKDGVKYIIEKARIKSITKHNEKIIGNLERYNSKDKEYIDTMYDKCNDYNNLVKDINGIDDETLEIKFEDLSDDGLSAFQKQCSENIQKIQQKIDVLKLRKSDVTSRIQQLQKAKEQLTDIMKDIPGARVEIDAAEKDIALKERQLQTGSETLVQQDIKKPKNCGKADLVIEM